MAEEQVALKTGEGREDDDAKNKRSLRDPNWMKEDAFQKNSNTKMDECFVTTLSRNQITGSLKLVNYDAAKLIRKGALLTLFCRGTVFSTSALAKGMVQYLIVFIIGFLFLLIAGEASDDGLESVEFEQEVIDSVAGIANKLRKPTMFIFGLFTSLTINRWWQLRITSLGSVMDAIVHNTSFLAACGTRKDLSVEDREAFEQDVMKVMKLGVASLLCICQQARGTMNYTSMVEDELLTVEEAGVLEKCVGSSAQVLWSWVCSLGDNILDRMKLPPPNHNPFFSEIQGASNAITRIEAYHDSQLPFPYVHMMVMLVNVYNLVQSFLDGLSFTQTLNILRKSNTSGGCTWDDCMEVKQVFACCTVVLHLVLVPTMYQALLHICFLIEDPLGDDITDFPISTFQLRIYAESKKVLSATREFWEIRRREGLIAPPAPAAAPAAAAAPKAAAEPKAAAAPPASATSGDAKNGVEEEIALQFEKQVMQQVADITASVDTVAQRVDDISKRLTAARAAANPAAS